MHILNNNITRIFNFIKRKLLILLIFILSGVAAVSAYTVFVITPVYSVSSTLIMKSSSEKNDDSNALTSINLLQRQVKTYLEISELPNIREEVNKSLDLTENEIKNIKSIKLTNDSGSQLLTLTIRSTDRELAERYAKQYIIDYKSFAADKIGRDDLSIVTDVVGSNNPVYPSLWKNMLISFIVFTFIGLNIIFIRFIMSDSIDSLDDLEELAGVSVLGMIPAVKEKERR